MWGGRWAGRVVDETGRSDRWRGWWDSCTDARVAKMHGNSPVLRTFGLKISPAAPGFYFLNRGPGPSKVAGGRPQTERSKTHRPVPRARSADHRGRARQSQTHGFLLQIWKQACRCHLNVPPRRKRPEKGTHDRHGRKDRPGGRGTARGATPVAKLAPLIVPPFEANFSSEGRLETDE